EGGSHAAAPAPLTCEQPHVNRPSVPTDGRNGSDEACQGEDRDRIVQKANSRAGRNEGGSHDARQPDGQGTFHEIAQQYQSGSPPADCAQNIGGTHLTAAAVPDVDAAHRSDDAANRDSADQISKYRDSEINGYH